MYCLCERDLEEDLIWKINIELKQAFDSDYLIENPEKSVRLLLSAAKTGHMRSRLLLVELLLDGFGSARDHKKAYDWLYHARFNKAEQRRQAQTLLTALANILPPNVVYSIQNRPLDEF